MARFIAVLPAGGSSRRAAQNKLVQLYKSKLLVPIAGTPALLKALQPFCQLHSFEKILIPVSADLKVEFLSVIEALETSSAEVHLVPGGETRQQSVFNALKFIKASEVSTEDLYVVVHDAARCYLSNELLRATLDQVLLHGAVSAAIEITDTVVEVGAEGELVKQLDRSVLRAVQTPQAFKFDWLYAAHLEASPDATDDASLVSKMHKVRYFTGERANLKLTTAEDLGC